MKKSKYIAMCIILTICMLVLSSCNSMNTENTKETIDLSKYPVNTDVELTYWAALDPNVSNTYTNYGETPFAKELEKRTGIKVKYVHPALGQEGEAFNLMVASNSFTDIIESAWFASFSGGPTTAINNKVILPLNDLMKDYAPNLSEFLAKNPDIDKSVKTDDNLYYCFPFIRNDKSLLMSAGPIIRKDWLDDLGLDIPVTVDDWEKMLTEFRDKKGAPTPLTILSSQRSRLFAMMDSAYDFYLENGQIKYGPLEPEYKYALETLNRWFQNGLLDKNFTLIDNSLLDASILNGKAGATYGSGGSGIGKWLNAAKDENFDLIGAPMPVGRTGEPNRFAGASDYYSPYGCAAISTNCKYPELAAKFLDYAYSEEGRIFFNFGTEGVSFNWEDGYPKYTNLIMNNPDGMSVSQAMAVYIRGSRSGPFIQDPRYLEQYYALDQQKEALKNWLTSFDASYKTKLPSFTFSAEESAEYANIMNEIDKYKNETSVEFIFGVKPLSEYDEFITNIKKMNIDRAIEIQQNAYTRYMNRK